MTEGLVLNRGIDRYKWQTVYEREIGPAAIFAWFVSYTRIFLAKAF